MCGARRIERAPEIRATQILFAALRRTVHFDRSERSAFDFACQRLRLEWRMHGVSRLRVR
jgi:hypothetical protein